MAEKRMIDANELMEHLARCIEEGKGLLRATLVAVKCFVEQMQTVDAVEVVHGRWIYFGGNHYTRISQCTNCCAKYDFQSNYCPNCGAKMDGERRTDVSGNT